MREKERDGTAIAKKDGLKQHATAQGLLDKMLTLERDQEMAGEVDPVRAPADRARAVQP